MKYLCLVYFEGATLDALTPEEHVELDRDSLDYNKELQRRGHLVHAEALQSPSQAITVRVRNQQISATDGPFAETKSKWRRKYRWPNSAVLRCGRFTRFPFPRHARPLRAFDRGFR